MLHTYYANYEPWLTPVNDRLQRYVDRRIFTAALKNEEARKVTTKAAFEKRAAEMRAVFAESLGPTPYNPATPLEARVTGTIVEEDLTIEKVVFTSRPHVYVTANVYIPRGLELPAPAVLFQPGHGYEGKGYPQYQMVARTIALSGLIVMLMDPPEQGERLSCWVKGEEKARVPGITHDNVGNLLYLAGRTHAAYFLADAMRAVDYLISRPDVDPSRIGATGSSGGGTMTSVLAVMDPRIAAAAPGTFLSTKEAISMASQGQDMEQMWPGTMDRGFDHHELISTFAPKPYLILVADADSFPIDGTIEIYNHAKECYRLYGKEENIQFFADRTTHAYTYNLAKAAGEFFTKAFGVETRPAPPLEKVNTPLPQEEINVTKAGQVTWEYPDAWPLWREAQEHLKNSYKPSKEVKQRALARIVHADDRPSLATTFRIYSTSEDGKVRYAMWFTERDLTAFGMILTENPEVKQPVTIAVFPNGTLDAPKYSDQLNEILASGRTLVVASLTGRGLGRRPKYRSADSPIRMDLQADHDLIFLGDSLAALLARDILGTCRVVENELGDSAPEIFATGEAAIWAQLAQGANPALTVRTEDAVTLSSFFENPYYNRDLLYTVRALGLAQYLD